jgi:hypothetical protein
MPTVEIDGMTTHDEISGSGPPILMMALGGFDSAVDRYLAVVAMSCQSLFDRDTISGAEPEELMALKLPPLILPGPTDFHATSCARYLEECIPGADYGDVHLESQPPDHIRDRILDFLATHASAGVHA